MSNNLQFNNKMNATSLYVSTCRLILNADESDQSSWSDLYRLVPYLRQSMSCTVCNNLLKEPFTPTDTTCQHHVCRKCKGGRKKLKPSCSGCKDYHKYVENCELRILLQCYKQLCEYFTSTDVYKSLVEQNDTASGSNGVGTASNSLIELIREGAGFSDNYQSEDGLSKSAYSILPCVYTNSSTQTQGAVASTSTTEPETSARDSPTTTLSNGSSLYSVMYAGTGNKITIKRKAVEEVTVKKEPVTSEVVPKENSPNNQSNFKKPVYRSRSSANKRKGCRCGNATATPGKLTCCGQRCPCYVDSKACVECKCKGCRNPHRPDGLKVRPHIPQMDDIQLSVPIKEEYSPQEAVDGLDTALDISAIEHSLSFDGDIKPNINVYTSQLQEVSASLPAAIMMDEEEVLASSPQSDSGSMSPTLDSTGIPSPHRLLLPHLNSLISYHQSPILSHPDNSSDVEVDV